MESKITYSIIAVLLANLAYGYTVLNGISTKILDGDTSKAEITDLSANEDVHTIDTGVPNESVSIPEIPKSNPQPRRDPFGEYNHDKYMESLLNKGIEGGRFNTETMTWDITDPKKFEESRKKRVSEIPNPLNPKTPAPAEVDSLEEQFRKSIEQVEAPEYKAQQEAEMKARIQQLKEEAEKQEKTHQQSYKGPFGSIFDLFKSHPILGILVVIVAVIYLNIRDYYKKLKRQ